jgi:hypothetical protein
MRSYERGNAAHARFYIRTSAAFFLTDVFMILPFENSEVEIAGIEPVTYRLRS